jgi:hypothetical protein
VGYRSDKYQLGRIDRRPLQSGGLDRQKRLYVTMGVGAAIMLLLGGGIGFALGRASTPAPEPTPAPVAPIETTMPAGVEEPVVTDPLEPEFTEEASASAETTSTDTEAPSTPAQQAPSDGAVVDATRVDLRWSKVDDDGPLTYAFEIQDRLSNGSWGNTQVIRDLKDTRYSARVLSVRRRWRVWAVDEAGNESAKSGWRVFTKKPAPVIRQAPTPRPAPTPAPAQTPDPSAETT